MCSFVRGLAARPDSVLETPRCLTDTAVLVFLSGHSALTEVIFSLRPIVGCSTASSFIVYRHFEEISREKRSLDRYRKIELALAEVAGVPCVGFECDLESVLTPEFLEPVDGFELKGAA